MPHRAWWQIVLSDMNTGRGREKGNVYAIVDNHGCIVGPRCRDERIGELEECVRVERFRAKLQHTRAAGEKRARNVQRMQARPARRIDIDDGVQAVTTNHKPPTGYAVSASLVSFGAAANRSMKAVLSRPAMKSGSLMILSCSGTVVLMPSMTVISSVRRIRAIAS